VITNQNWDEVGANSNIGIVKVTGDPVTIRLKNVILNNSEINMSPISYNGDAFEEGDYACVENVTNNTTKFILSDYGGTEKPLVWAGLLLACPD